MTSIKHIYQNSEANKTGLCTLMHLDELIYIRERCDQRPACAEQKPSASADSINHPFIQNILCSLVQ